jgi:hypothetical protein
MAVMLDGSQRDTVYQALLDDLTGIGDVAISAGNGKVETARRLRCRFEQDCRLLDQIGWEPDGGRGVYAITLPSDEIRALFARLHERATGIINDAVSEFATKTLSEAFSVVEIATVVLGELPGGQRHRP